MLRRFFSTLFILLFVVLAGWVGYLYWLDHQPRESVYDPQIASITRAAGVDPFLVRALIWRESRFDPNTHGEADEHGLMQVTPEVGQMWAKANKVEVKDLQHWNKLSGHHLKVGQTLVMQDNVKAVASKKAATTYKVQKGDSLYIVAKRFNVEMQHLKRLNPRTGQALKPGQILTVSQPR